MSGYILCRTKRASVPYFIENISTNIYSLEELCYYLYHNLYLIDSTIMNEGLCQWLDKELELPGLAAKLKPSMGKFAGAEDVLYPIFKEINYLAYEELRALNMRLAVLNNEHPTVRLKKKGDALVENGMYVNAIKVYHNVLKEKELEQIKPGMTCQLYHNLGCIYSYLFQMEKAAEYFLKAYQWEKSPENGRTWLLALHTITTREEWEKQASLHGADDQVKEQAEKLMKEFDQREAFQADKEEIDTMLSQIMKEYHRSTGS